MKNFVPAAILALIFGGVIVAVQPLPMAAKRLPGIVGMIGLILTCLLIVGAVWPKKRQATRAGAQIADLPSTKELVTNKALAATGAWIGAILLFVYFLGFTIGLPLYVLLYSRLHGGRWLASIALALSVWAFVYLLFIAMLQFVFPVGLLFRLVT